MPILFQSFNRLEYYFRGNNVMASCEYIHWHLFLFDVLDTWSYSQSTLRVRIRPFENGHSVNTIADWIRQSLSIVPH